MSICFRAFSYSVDGRGVSKMSDCSFVNDVKCDITEKITELSEGASYDLWVIGNASSGVLNCCDEDIFFSILCLS